MNISRRHLLGSAALATATLVLSRKARAQTQGVLPPLFVSVEAAGAWDPTFLTDPVGGDPRVTPWDVTDLLRTGNLTYAPARLPGEATTVAARYDFNGEDFFARWRDSLTIFRGVDNQTVSHDVGPRVTFAGSNREGHPVLASLAAVTAMARLDAPPPLAFIATGGYTEAAGLVPTSRAGSPTTLLGLTLPNSARPGDPAPNQQFHSTPAHARLRAWREARDQRLRGSTNGPRLRSFLNRVGESRGADTTAAFDALAPAMAAAEAIGGPRGSLTPAAAAVLGAMRDGACVAAHIDAGGFDTHDDHDAEADGQRFALRRLLEGIDFIARQVEATPALASRGVVVLVGSDFGRTFYNGTGGGRGKDHWPITSMMTLALGSAQTLLGGNRVIGGTTIGTAKGMLAQKIKLQAGAVVTVAANDESALTLTPALIHQTLHAKLGIDPDLLQRFALPGLPVQPLPFFD